jgi:Xaa-Pro aminopeptidase
MLQSHIEQLKTKIKQYNVDCFIVPSIDEFQSEYCPSYAKRLEWLTGFDGSNGTAIITLNKCAFFTDGRYILQAQSQLDTSIFEIYNFSDKSIFKWLKENLLSGQKIAYDATLISGNSYQNHLSELNDFELVFLPNLVDLIWLDKPAKPSTELYIHPIEYCGTDYPVKIKNLIAELNKDKIYAQILTEPEIICWLLNIRGSDIEYAPIALLRAIIYSDNKVEIFTDAMINAELKDYFNSLVHVYEFDKFIPKLKLLSKKVVAIDSSHANISIINALNDSTIITSENNLALKKACKNEVELNGAVYAHNQDAIALIEFFYYLEQNISRSKITELTVSEKLLGHRKKLKDFIYPSFATIAGFNENGAIIHYNPSDKSNKTIEGDGLLLIDSGGQYKYGTTDVTRTLTIGKANLEQKQNYTRVLKGHISLSRAKFPIGTTGSQLDSIARFHLWQAGLDYDHGTGHGVGSFLSVHEGPQRISKMGNNVKLMPGMIISNEPGYYYPGHYGIRIENLIVVKKDIFYDNFLCFDTLTMVPYDKNLIELDLLTVDEIDWINEYHQCVWQNVSPLIDDKNVLNWLKVATNVL